MKRKGKASPVKKKTEILKKNNGVSKKSKTSFKTSTIERVDKRKPRFDSLKPSNKPVDVSELESRLNQLKEQEDTGNKKLRKKIRRLEYLKKKYTQIQNTESCLSLSTPISENVDDISTENDEPDMDRSELDDGKNELNEKSQEDEKKKAMKGIKRFVLFVGNLSKSTSEEDVRSHFHKVGTIKSIRFPQSNDTKKGGYAFLEVENSLSFEKTLSMHHTMLNNKRINVLYTNPDGANLDKKEIKKKNAKFDAMRKSGLLAGSIAQHKKRSHRRKKKKLAENKATALVNIR